jgi:putative ATP-binding cassette transporter
MTELLKVVMLLVRLSKDVAHSGTLVAIIIIAGLISGVSNTLLIATINSTLNNTGTPRSTLILTFAGLCLALASLRFVSGAVLVHLMKAIMMSLRLGLSRKILNAPLRRLEQHGSHKLFAALTGDVPSIANLYVLALATAIARCLGVYGCWRHQPSISSEEGTAIFFAVARSG